MVDAARGLRSNRWARGPRPSAGRIRGPRSRAARPRKFPSRATIGSSATPQLRLEHLAAVAFRKRGDELDRPGSLVGRERFAHVRLELFGERLGRTMLRREHEKGLRFLQAVGILKTDHRCFDDRGMGEQGIFYLQRREPPAAHLQHLVSPSAEPEVARFVLPEFVRRNAPVAPEGLLALLVLLPVFERHRVPADPESADLPAGSLATVVIADLRVVALHHPAQGPQLYIVQAVGDEDVKHLGRAYPIEDLDPGRLLPAMVQLRGERFTGADAHAKG